jgi:hypothetical protein
MHLFGSSVFGDESGRSGEAKRRQRVEFEEK